MYQKLVEIVLLRLFVDGYFWLLEVENVLLGRLKVGSGKNGNLVERLGLKSTAY